MGVMTAIGISSVVMMGMIHVLQVGLQGQKTISNKNHFRDMAHEISLILQDDSACGELFSGKSINRNPAQLGNLQNFNIGGSALKNTHCKAGDKLPSGSCSIEKVDFSGLRVSPSSSLQILSGDTSTNTYNWKLVISANGEDGKPLSIRPLSIFIRGQLSGPLGNSTVVNCRSSGAIGGSGKIDYTDCVKINHSEEISGSPGHCQSATWDPATDAPLTPIGECPPDYVVVSLSTGIRFPSFCRAAYLNCCRLN